MKHSRWYWLHKISFQSLVPAIFYPQARDMHVWSLLQIKPPPHQWNKYISLKSYRALGLNQQAQNLKLGSCGAETVYCFLKKVLHGRSQNRNNRPQLAPCIYPDSLDEPYRSSVPSSRSASHPRCVTQTKRALSKTKKTST